jgi:hypothetical protein
MIKVSIESQEAGLFNNVDVQLPPAALLRQIAK